MILVPPEAPATIRTSPSLSTKIAGADEDIGRFPGAMKFADDGSTPNAFFTPGVEKSSISLLKMIPVRFPRYLQPKLKQKTSLYSILAFWISEQYMKIKKSSTSAKEKLHKKLC